MLRLRFPLLAATGLAALVACSDSSLEPKGGSPIRVVPRGRASADLMFPYDCVIGTTTTTCHFASTNAPVTWTVPTGVTEMTIDAFGAQGESRIGTAGFGGKGGRATATLDVVGGSQLTVVVGGVGELGGGGRDPSGFGNGGGGASDVRTGTPLTGRIIVAGGGGGAGQTEPSTTVNGGAGGGLVGGDGEGEAGGFGGTQNAGGAGRFGGSAGALGVGGAGAFLSYGSGGGGGGYYGGGGGGAAGGCAQISAECGHGGGGGSSYIAPNARNASTESGVNVGAGYIDITFATVPFGSAFATGPFSRVLTIGGSDVVVVKAVGLPTPTVSVSGNLPAGLVFTPHTDGTGTFSGTPASLSGGRYPINVSASNGVGPTATLVVTLDIVGREEVPFNVAAHGPTGEVLQTGIGIAFATSPAVTCSGTIENGTCGLFSAAAPPYARLLDAAFGAANSDFSCRDNEDTDVFPLPSWNYPFTCAPRFIVRNSALVTVSTTAQATAGGQSFLFRRWDTSAQGVACNEASSNSCTFAIPSGGVNLVAIYGSVTAPSTSVVMTPATPNGQNGWYTTGVSMAVSASVSGPGVETRCVVDPTSAPASFGDLPVGACPTSVDADGSHVLYAASSDNGVSGAVVSASFKIDKTKPTLSPTVSPNPVLLNGAASVDTHASDAMPGVTSNCATLNTGSVGGKSVMCTATDNAGNTATASVSYQVTYQFDGFASLVNRDALNGAKAGQTIPLKWRLTDATGAPVTNLTTATVTVASLVCTLGSTANQVEESAAGGSGLQNLGNGYYQFNWNTPKSYSGSCKTMQLNLGEGITRNALFAFNK